MSWFINQSINQNFLEINKNILVKGFILMGVVIIMIIFAVIKSDIICKSEIFNTENLKTVFLVFNLARQIHFFRILNLLRHLSYLNGFLILKPSRIKNRKP